MRYYSITITSSEGENITWTSHPGGVYSSSALNVIFDIPVVSFVSPTGSAVITIEGVPITDLRHYNNFTNYSIEVYAGMKEGLPLSANQPPPALIFKGTVVHGFGNWVGTQMSLNLFISASKFDYSNPGNFTLIWSKGQTLQDTLTQCFNVAYGENFPKVFNINQNIVLNHDEYGIYFSLSQLAQAINDMTRGLFFGPDYPGIHITIQNGVIIVWDDSQTTPTVELKYTDLIGQPAWVGSDTLYVMTVLKSNITVGNKIKLPKGIPNIAGFVTTVPSFQNSYQNYDLTFQGDFTVIEVRHVGNFRSDSGEEWASVIKCIGNKTS